MRTLTEILEDINYLENRHEHEENKKIKYIYFRQLILLKNELARTNIAIKKGEWK